MKTSLSLLILLLFLATFAAGLAYLFERRFEPGQVYPPHSSLRADRLGTAILYESLERLPGVSVRRDFRGFRRPPPGRGTTWIHLGVRADDLRALEHRAAEAIERFLGDGGRLVIALSAKGPWPPARKSPPEEEAGGEAPERVSFEARWGVRFGAVPIARRARGDGGPVAVCRRSEGLPRAILWRAQTVLEDLEGSWEVIYERDEKAVLAERRSGRGTLVLAADSFVATNAAMVEERYPDLLAWLVGPSRHVVFEEAHLGLYAPPHAEEEVHDVAGRDSAAGFVNLLRRNIPEYRLVEACIAEWKKTFGCGGLASARSLRRLAALEDVEKALRGKRLRPAEASKVIIGQEDAIDKALIVIFTGNHALVEGVPGVAKTLLVRTLARVLGCDFARIQFTPDLMPADITGTNVFDFRRNEFSLIRGPVFTSFLLADEINRAPAKTQSALLQAMQERAVTIDRETYPLPPNFTVFATQNPIEYEGTYPLPEAQKDRFMLKILMNPPERSGELELARRTGGNDAPEAVLASGAVRPVLGSEDLAALRGELEAVTVRDELVAYIVDVIRATRGHEGVLVGAGPRATQALLLASRAYAAVSGRDFVTPDDARAMAGPVLEHRLILRPEFEVEGLSVPEVVQEILQKVAVPR